MRYKILAVLMALAVAGGIAVRASASTPQKNTVVDCHWIGFSGHATSNQNISSGTATVLAQSLDCDTFGDWAAPNNKYIVGTGQHGTFLLQGEACFDAVSTNDTTRRLLEFRVNGSGGYTQGLSQMDSINSASLATCLDISTLIHLDDNDYVQLVAHQSSGSTVTVEGARFSLIQLACDAGC